MKRIESPSKRWPGYVILHDPLNLDMVFAVEDAREQLVEVEETKSKLLVKVNEKLQAEGKPQIIAQWSSRSHKYMIPVLIKCVSEWHIENFPDKLEESNFPSSPRNDSRDFISWIWDEIDAIYSGNIEIPNES